VRYLYPQPGISGNSTGILGRVDFKKNEVGSIVEFRRVNRASDGLIEQTFDLRKKDIEWKISSSVHKNLNFSKK
jgi:hypothetical protein